MPQTSHKRLAGSYPTPRGRPDFHIKSTGERIHVAAVCYRLQDDVPEFLLVRTRGGRWTFPKGGVDNDATHAAAAAREAYEEAGVHGQIEREPFHWYFHSKGSRSTRLVAVQAHLCEVERLVAPQEDHRNPTWFQADKARRRLQQNRPPQFAAEISHLIDRAILRIRARSRPVA